jgi:hypothetical protein
MERAGLFVVALFAAELQLDPVVVAADEAQLRQPVAPARASMAQAFRYVAGDGTVIHSNLPMESLLLTTRGRFTRNQRSQ